MRTGIDKINYLKKNKKKKTKKQTNKNHHDIVKRPDVFLVESEPDKIKYLAKNKN